MLIWKLLFLFMFDALKHFNFTEWQVNVFSRSIICFSSLHLHLSSLHLLSGCFSVRNVVPQPDGDSSKVKVKVRVNIHGILNVSSASLIEKLKGEAEDMQIEPEPLVQNEGRAEEQVRFWSPPGYTESCQCKKKTIFCVKGVWHMEKRCSILSWI